MIQLNDIHKTYQGPNGNIDIIKGISLSIAPKSSIAITGPSGSGKSTLLRILAGLDEPTKGRVILNNQNIYDLDDDERAQIRSQTFGFIFQSFRLFPALTVLENVSLSVDIKGDLNSTDIAKEWLNHVGLSDRYSHLPEALSGGERQRVAIARALAPSPSIIVADEPTGNLDQKNSDSLQTLLNDCIEKSNAALVLVTHDSQLATMCETRHELSNGQLFK
ncbi:ABC transporter [Candidatus Marinamargulisbacteria bacterium SCGC AG-343-K17]|nr:ABC transporter [Candidatus Marinamargulisbacteria bacterium SCGC AG-343-K17]